MKKKAQKDAVFDAVVSVLHENNVEFVVDETILADCMDKDLRTAIIDELFTEFRQEKIVLNKTFNDKELKTYIGGLVSNWTKKDLRLNGNIPHEIKRPNSRIGQSDPMVRELRKMAKAVKGTVNEEPVKRELRNRQNLLRKEQISSIKIDKSLIPDSLQHLLETDTIIHRVEER